MVVVRDEQLANVAGAAAGPQHSGPRGHRTGRRAACLPRANARASPTGHRRPVKRWCISLGKRRRLGRGDGVDLKALWDAAGQTWGWVRCGGLRERDTWGEALYVVWRLGRRAVPLPRTGNGTEAGARGAPGSKPPKLRLLCALQVLMLGRLLESWPGAGGELWEGGPEVGGNPGEGGLGGWKKRVSKKETRCCC